MSEDKPPQVPNPYALTKYVSERLTHQYGEYLEIPALSFRYFNVYGQNQSLSNPYTGVLSVFFTRLASNKPIVVFEDGNMSRDFIHVSDIAKYNVMALDKGEGVFNLGTGVPTKINDLIQKISKNVGLDPKLEYTGESRVGDIRNVFSDNNNFFKTFGTTTFKKLEWGIKEFVEWASHQEFNEQFDRAEKERKFYSPDLSKQI